MSGKGPATISNGSSADDTVGEGVSVGVGDTGDGDRVGAGAEQPPAISASAVAATKTAGRPRVTNPMNAPVVWSPQESIMGPRLDSRSLIGVSSLSP